MNIVIDCSIAIAWCIREENVAAARSLAKRVSANGAQAPSIWPTEVINVLSQAEARGRISAKESVAALADLAALPITVEPASPRRLFAELLPVARSFALTAYNAAYLELALRLQVPLATFDQRLATAAKAAGVTIVKR